MCVITPATLLSSSAPSTVTKPTLPCSSTYSTAATSDQCVTDAEIFEKYAPNCQEIKLETWRKRSLPHRFVDNVFYLFNEVL